MVQDVPGHGNPNGLTLLVLSALIASSGPFALCTNFDQPSATSTVITSSSQQTPAYEVATIKPPGANDFAMPLRVYIQSAFGIPVNSTGWVIGPDWINSAKYVIHGKPPDSIRGATQAMTPAQRSKDEQLVQQSLLVDRFKLKAHFETRDMPVYELMVAKDGPKLKGNHDSTVGQIGANSSGIWGRSGALANGAASPAASTA